MRRCCEMLRAEALSAMELVLPLLCLCVLSCSGSTSAAGAEPKRINVMEGRDAILPCSTTGDITYQRFEWKKDGQMEVYLYDGTPMTTQHEQFKGRVSHFPGELKTGNASIIVRNTMVTDTGTYTCEFPRLNQKVLIILLVAGDSLKDINRENIRGTASKPSISILSVTTNRARLQCVVHGDLVKPVVQWNDSDENIIPAEEPQVSEEGGRYTVVLKTTVTKSGNYSCIATQKEISHQIGHYTYVSVPGPETPPETSETGWIGVVIGAVCAAVVVGVVLGVCGILAVQKCRR